MAMVAYNPPNSLWSLIEEHVSPHETEEIRSMLGISLIEQSLDLHKEVETLLEIWRALKEESDNKPKPLQLPEPPQIRERLVQEILFFVQAVKEKASDEGLDPEKVISKHKSSVINYAFQSDSGSGTPRSLSARSVSGRETPMVPSNSTRSHDEVEAAREVVSKNDKLNFLQFDEVVCSLRNHLEKEVEHLLEDITFLQQCIDEEACGGCGTSGLEREPTLSELREERSLLEKEMLSSTVKTSKNPVSDLQRNGKALPSSIKLHTSQPLLGVKPSPLKATHQLGPAVQNLTYKTKTPSPQDILMMRPHTSTASGRLKVVSVNKVLDPYGDAGRSQLTPPPGTSRSTTPNRPSSASRFRQMVLECREGD